MHSVDRRLKYGILALLITLTLVLSGCYKDEVRELSGETILIKSPPPKPAQLTPFYSITKDSERAVIPTETRVELDSEDTTKHEKSIQIGEDFLIDGAMCKSTSLGYKECKHTEKAINITLRNGLGNIAGTYFRIYYSSNKSLTYPFDEDIGKKESKTFNIDLTELGLTFDMVDKFEVYPLIKINNTLKACYNKKLYVSPFSCREH
ncbi:hypothetical protein HN419_07460 [Candidatus Woesearchaeota archaeon]|jgi:hypothetical protein|nr:hypothetical protein [Candidatus Woesearchaeota archaeon]MBT3538331.1 hypothetical protein [Candidatus Woesearchaeota archaeon]MBT4698308.1 hypothetical protein [Candidatus Woesearchaeota archaeon]MBT4716793.1 hypothetical protein [Candidatus Woesearchaeota archaeon]MBT7106000.1 hypothetical protein [Candidatus Woesearchaeota archaeon]